MDELEDLLHAARAQQNATGAARARRRAADPNYYESFRNDTWVFTGQVQLVYAEDEVRILVGLFDEYRHERVKDCRRLVSASARREEARLKIEEVKGWGWLSEKAWEVRRQPAVMNVDVVERLEISLGQVLRAPAVYCRAVLSNGGMQRVVVMEEAVFRGDTPTEMLTIPPNTDVLEVLTQKSKEDLWKILTQSNTSRS